MSFRGPIMELGASVLLLSSAACVGVGELDDLKRNGLNDSVAPPQCVDGDREATHEACGAGDAGMLFMVCTDGRFRTTDCVVEPVCDDGDTRDVDDPAGTCEPMVPLRQDCSGGQWGATYCPDTCKYFEYECGTYNNRSCGTCVEDQHCNEALHVCEEGAPILGTLDPTTGYQWQVARDPMNDASMSHDEALQACERLEVKGMRGFRLATISELRTLVPDCPNIAVGGACGVTDGCSEVSCYGTGETCVCPSGENDSECYGGEIALLFDMGSGCAALWSSTETATDAWLLSFDATLNHREKTYRAQAACVLDSSTK